MQHENALTEEVIQYYKSIQEGLNRLWEWNGIKTNPAMLHTGANNEF